MINLQINKNMIQYVKSRLISDKQKVIEKEIDKK
jgi:hypothetical protein